MLKSVVIAGLALALSGSIALAKPVCRDAKGHFAKCPAAAPAPQPPSGVSPVPAMPAASMASPAAAGHPQCKKGKVCGHSCIAMNKVCHKS